jgi:hypothetical protein
MSCFGKGFFGALIVLIMTAIILPQYSDYAASAETSVWMYQVAPVQDYVAANAERNRTLVDSGVGAKRPEFSSNAPSLFEVTKEGTIFLQGGHGGQLVVLIPTLADRKVSWRCLGGPRKATLRCKDAP